LIVFTALLANCRETPTQLLPSRLEIAFSREDAPYQQNIYIMARTAAIRRLSPRVSSQTCMTGRQTERASCARPAPLSTNYSQVIMNVDSTGKTVVAGKTYKAKWSPDGSKPAQSSAHDVAFNGEDRTR
jgi:hypothetical protein